MDAQPVHRTAWCLPDSTQTRWQPGGQGLCSDPQSASDSVWHGHVAGGARECAGWRDISMDVSQMNQVLEVFSDAGDLDCRVQPGVTREGS